MQDNEVRWEKIIHDVETVDWLGNEIILRNIPAEKHKTKGTVRVNIDDVILAEQKALAEDVGIEPLELPILLTLYAEPQYVPKAKGYVKQTFRFNKMLFMIWKDLDKIGYPAVHDNFRADRAGPVPVNFKPLMDDLATKGLVVVSWSFKPGVSSEFRLTEKGLILANKLWKKIPDEVKGIILDVKRHLFLVDAAQLRHLIHQMYPEYKKTYTELDKED